LCVDPDWRTIPDIFSSFIRKGERRWPYGNSEERFARAGFMLQLGWRSMSLRDFIAAAKVERAASAGRVASDGTCLHLCRYSADTLHPSPKLYLYKNEL
jgi:hypothetical protein